MLITLWQVTIVNTVHLHTPGTFLSIGAPVPNTSVYVLDENMQPVPIGEPGTMWAGGACVSKGYVNLPEKTAERYKLDPFTNDGYVPTPPLGFGPSDPQCLGIQIFYVQYRRSGPLA